MKSRYNIALLPVSKNAEFIERAKCLYHMAYNYRLGAHALPHVTLCQFYAEPAEITEIWQKVLATPVTHSIILALNDFSFFTAIDYNWVSLRPNQLDTLQQIHSKIAGLMKEPLGKCFENFDAHLTLINTKDENFINKATAALTLSPIQDQFILTLGKSDELGQYQEVIHQISY